jgi:hypothetical protein
MLGVNNRNPTVDNFWICLLFRCQLFRSLTPPKIEGCVSILITPGANFIKSWMHGIKHRAQPNLGKNVISWVQSPNAWCQIRVYLCAKMNGRTVQISSLGQKLLYEIHPGLAIFCFEANYMKPSSIICELFYYIKLWIFFSCVKKFTRLFFYSIFCISLQNINIMFYLVPFKKIIWKKTAPFKAKLYRTFMVNHFCKGDCPSHVKSLWCRAG